MDENLEEVLMVSPISEEDVWLDMFNAISARAVNPAAAIGWADEGLAAFQVRFRRAGMRCDA